MRIITGLHYPYKLNQMIQECYTQATQHPFESYLFICENPSVAEQLFFQYTHCLVNIQIMTWSQFLHQCIIDNHLTHHHVITSTQLTYHLRHIFKNNTFKCFQTEQIYPLIQKFIPLMKEYDLNHIDYQQSTFTDPKLTDFICLYHLLLERLDQTTHLTQESILENCSLESTTKHIYIEADHLYQTRRQEIIHKLDQHHSITMLYTYQNDQRLLNLPFHDLCKKGINIDQPSFLTENIFNQVNTSSQEDMNIYTFSSSTPQQEVKKILCTIYQNIVDHKMHYQDFMIVYPDSTYVPILLHMLHQFNLPHNLTEATSCQYDQEYKTILKDCSLQKETTFKDIANHYLQSDLSQEYIDYFNELSHFDDSITTQEFIQFFQTTYLKNHAQNKDYQDFIHIYPIEQVRIAKPKHIYFMGMNETIFPRIIKDTSLILDEDIEHMKQKQVNVPLTTTQQLGLHHNDILKAFLQPYITITLSYSKQTLSGGTLLKSSLYNQLNEMYHPKQLPDPTFLSLDDYYQKGGYIKSKQQLNQNIQEFKTNKNQVYPLSSHLIKQLYSSHLSVSQIETYNKCPFLYFIQYGLKIFPTPNDQLMPNELGSLIHYVLSLCIDESHDIPTLVQSYIEKNELLQNKINKSFINQYFIEQLIKDLSITLTVLHRNKDISSFQVVDKEKKVKDTIANMQFEGCVDRIDTFDNFVSIIDYKSSAKDINLNLAMQGFNIQMLLYLEMVTNEMKKNPGAVLYFNTKKRILSSKDELVAPLNSQEFYKQYRYNGYIIDDENHSIIHALDPTFDKRSDIINVSYVKSRNEYKGQLLTTQQLDILLENIENHIYELYQNMIGGHIEIAPKGSDNNTIHTQVNPCHYCPYHSICNYDVFYNDYTLIDMLDVDKILKGDDE